MRFPLVQSLLTDEYVVSGPNQVALGVHGSIYLTVSWGGPGTPGVVHSGEDVDLLN